MRSALAGRVVRYGPAQAKARQTRDVPGVYACW